MSEMIYGNTGRRDEGINIDMDQALYQKLQSRVFVPKLKSMLNDRLQEGDKNFVFIGEVADKNGNFSVYGYNAKLESDSRGGDYGHYIAVPVNEKAVALEPENAKFLTEEGFIEYVNLKNLNEEKRFNLSAISATIQTNAKKRIIGGLMETFMKVRKRKNVTLAIDDCSVEEFNGKAIFILQDLMQYLPYRMRKNVSFISHIASNQKIPDMINFAVFPVSSEYRPHDCINGNSDIAPTGDGAFAGYVEKVFAMSDAEREAYFEKLHKEVELPAIEKGVDIRSDSYLLDISTKILWETGETEAAIVDIFNSIDEVLRVYPEYKRIAIERLTKDKESMIGYIANEIAATANVGELKNVYNKVKSLFSVCEFSFSDDVIILFKTKASGFIANVETDAELIEITDGVMGISVDVFDMDVAVAAVNEAMAKKMDINSIHTLYLKLRERKNIDLQKLNECLKTNVENIIGRVTGRYNDNKGKLSALDRMYSEFKDSSESRDHSHIVEIYERFRADYASGVNADATNKGNEIVFKVDKELRTSASFLDTKNYIKELVDVDIHADAELKRRTIDVYGRAAAKLIEQLTYAQLSYEDVKKIVDEIAPAVKNLHAKGIYDVEPQSGWGEEKILPDSLYKLVTGLETLMDNLHKADTVTDAIYSYEKAFDGLGNTELRIKGFYEKHAEKILWHCFDRDPKAITEKSFRKAEKELSKKHNKTMSLSTRRAVKTYISNKSGKKDGKKSSKKGKTIVISLIAIVLLATAGLLAYKFLFASEGPKYYITEAEKAEVEAYIAGFAGEELGEASFIVGTIRPISAEEAAKEDAEGKGMIDVITDTALSAMNRRFEVTVKDTLGTEYKETFIAVYDSENKNAKSFHMVESIPADKKIVLVVQKNTDGSKIFIKDVFEAPEKFAEYNYDSEYKVGDKVEEFGTKVLKYVGLKKGIVKVEEPPKPEEVNADEQKENPEKPEATPSNDAASSNATVGDAAGDNASSDETGSDTATGEELPQPAQKAAA